MLDIAAPFCLIIKAGRSVGKKKMIEDSGARSAYASESVFFFPTLRPGSTTKQNGGGHAERAIVFACVNIQNFVSLQIHIAADCPFFRPPRSGYAQTAECH